MDDTHTRTHAVPTSTLTTLTTLARRYGVPEYRLGMFAVLLTLPVVSAMIAALV